MKHPSERLHYILKSFHIIINLIQFIRIDTVALFLTVKAVSDKSGVQVLALAIAIDTSEDILLTNLPSFLSTGTLLGPFSLL